MVARTLLPLIFVFGIANGAAQAAAPPDPFGLYGQEMVFSVWRSGDEIGQHRVTFARKDGALMVRSQLDLAVKMLGVTVYRFTYAALETWRDGRLMRLDSSVDDDGKAATVEAKAEQDKLAVTGPAGNIVVDGTVLPSTHWNAQMIDAERVINTLSGKLDQIKLVPSGTETVDTGAGSRPATHYVWSGEIKAESWYDDAGRWVKLRFAGKDGTPIEYVCMRCLAPAP